MSQDINADGEPLWLCAFTQISLSCTSVSKHLGVFFNESPIVITTPFHPFFKQPLSFRAVNSFNSYHLPKASKSS